MFFYYRSMMALNSLRFFCHFLYITRDATQLVLFDILLFIIVMSVYSGLHNKVAKKRRLSVVIVVVASSLLQNIYFPVFQPFFNFFPFVNNIKIKIHSKHHETDQYFQVMMDYLAQLPSWRPHYYYYYFHQHYSLLHQRFG